MAKKKVKRKKLGKTKQRLKALTRSEVDVISHQIEVLMQNKMKYIVNLYIRSYRVSCKNSFGWEDDDLKQYIVEALWYGLATFKKSKKIKVETYLSCVLRNWMINLSKKCKRKKYIDLNITYSDESWSEDTIIVHDNPEDILLSYDTFFDIVDEDASVLNEFH